MTTHVDWRGTPINIGDLVVYGAGVGRSTAMVEAQVAGFAKEKVKLKVIRRSFGGGEQPIVTVGADRMTVVNSLPPTTKPTQAEDNIISKRKSIAYHENRIQELLAGQQSIYHWDSIDYHKDRVIELEREIERLTVSVNP